MNVIPYNFLNKSINIVIKLNFKLIVILKIDSTFIGFYDRKMNIYLSRSAYKIKLEKDNCS
jgi:small nuclear ribonucleoprotein (snRNP)-like protein